MTACRTYEYSGLLPVGNQIIYRLMQDSDFRFWLGSKQLRHIKVPSIPDRD